MTWVVKDTTANFQKKKNPYLTTRKVSRKSKGGWKGSNQETFCGSGMGIFGRISLRINYLTQHNSTMQFKQEHKAVTRYHTSK